MNDAPASKIVHPQDQRRPSVSIAGLMVFVVAAALLAMAARHANRAVWEADESNYAGDGDSQFLCVLCEAVPSILFAILAGAVCGPTLNRAFPGIRRFQGRSTLAVVLFVGLLFQVGPENVPDGPMKIYISLAIYGFWGFGIACIHYHRAVNYIKTTHADEFTRGW